MESGDDPYLAFKMQLCTEIFVGYLLYVLIGVRLRLPRFQPKEAPRKQEKPAEISIPMDLEAEVA